MPQTPFFDYVINENRLSTTISIDGKDRVLTTQDITQLILWLGQVRSEMNPQVSHVFQLNEVCLPTDNLQVLPMIQGTEGHMLDITFRSPHFGWLKHSLSSNQLERLVNLLLHPEMLIPPKFEIN